jgi:coenzyme F420-reducing hydrogenase alpha subunit
MMLDRDGRDVVVGERRGWEIRRCDTEARRAAETCMMGRMVDQPVKATPRLLHELNSCAICRGPHGWARTGAVIERADRLVSRYAV